MFSAENVEANTWGPIDASKSGDPIATTTAAVVAITTSAAGRIRRMRRIQKLTRLSFPVALISRTISDVIRNPEMTKNTSTPAKPLTTA